MDNFIPVNEPIFIGNEKKYLNECIDTGWISSAGRFITDFEELMSKRCERNYGVAVSSGTAALEIAVKCLGIKEGDEVIMPALTIISCSNSVIKAGGTPVLVDCDERTFNMTLETIKEKVTDKTKAIMIVHIYGLPVDMDPILEFAKERGIKIIEDAAEMHGQTYKGRPCGKFGDVSIFSFYANKHVSTGEGGMLLTNDKEIAEKAQSLRDHCFMKGRRFLHDDIGGNFRMTNLQAAVGLAQLECLDTYIKKKREMGRLYSSILSDSDKFDIPIIETEYAKNVYWVYAITLKNEFYKSSDDIVSKLRDSAIGTRPFFWPLHKQPIYQEMGLFKNESYPVSEKLSQLGFYLPSGLALTPEQIERSANALIEAVSS